MGTDNFTCLLDDVEPDRRPPWPSIMRETLYMLLEDEESKDSKIVRNSLEILLLTLLRHPRLKLELIDWSAYDNPPDDSLQSC